MGEDNADYVTILETFNRHKYLVVVMKYHGDDYIQSRVSQALPRPAAQALARSWATTMALEIR